MYDNEFETTENKILIKKKMNYNRRGSTVKVKLKAQKEALFVYIIYHKETKLRQGGILLFTDLSVFVKTKLCAKLSWIKCLLQFFARLVKIKNVKVTQTRS